MWALCDLILCKRFYVRGFMRGGFGVWVFRLRGFWCAWGCAFRLGLGEISLIDSKQRDKKHANSRTKDNPPKSKRPKPCKNGKKYHKFTHF